MKKLLVCHMVCTKTCVTGQKFVSMFGGENTGIFVKLIKIVKELVEGDGTTMEETVWRHRWLCAEE